MSSGFALKNGALLLSTEAPGGIYNAEQLRQVAKISEDGSMIVKVTEDQRLAIVVTKEQLTQVKQDLAQVGLEVRHYQEGLHQATSCLGKLCSEYKQDALKSSVQISEAMSGLVISSAVKIGLNGCSRCCNPTHTLDISVVGDESGYRIALGGKSAMIPEFGQFVADSVPAEKLPLLMRSVVETYGKIGVSGESMQDVIERVGLGPFAKVLTPWSQDAGVDESFAEDSSRELSVFPGESDGLLDSEELSQDEFSELGLEEDDLNLEGALETSDISLDSMTNLQLESEEGGGLSLTASSDLGAIDLENVGFDNLELETLDLANVEIESTEIESSGVESLDSDPILGGAVDAVDLDAVDLDSVDLDAAELEDIELSGLDDGDLGAISNGLTMDDSSRLGDSEIKMTLDDSEDVSIDLEGLESLDAVDIAIHDTPELNLDEGMNLKVDKVSENLSSEVMEIAVDDDSLELPEDDDGMDSLGGELSLEGGEDLENLVMEVSELDHDLEEISLEMDQPTELHDDSIAEAGLDKFEDHKTSDLASQELSESTEIADEELGEFGKLQGAVATDADADEIEKKLDSEVDEQLGFQHLSEDENEMNREETLNLLDDDSLDGSELVSLSEDSDSELMDRDSSALEDLAFQAEDLSREVSEEFSNETSEAVSRVKNDFHAPESDSPSSLAQSNVKPIRSVNSKVHLEDMDMDLKGQVYLKFSNGLVLELGSEIFDGTKKTLKLAGVALKIDSTNGSRSFELDGIKFSIPVAAA